MMFKYRIRMFFNELKVLVLMRSGSGSDPEPRSGSSMRGLGVGGCGWPPCASRGDDDEEYYGPGVADPPRPRSLGLDEKDSKLGAAPLDAVSLTSSLDSGMRTPQCRICFQGPEQSAEESKNNNVASAIGIVSTISRTTKWMQPVEKIKH